MTGGPNEMFGTKWPSITSRWIQSAPAASMARSSSPALAKSQDSMEGAISSGRIRKPLEYGRSVSRVGCWGNAPGQRLKHRGHQIDWELRDGEIKPGQLRDGCACGGKHQAHIAVARRQPECERLASPEAGEDQRGERREAHRESKRQQSQTKDFEWLVQGRI